MDRSDELCEKAVQGDYQAANALLEQNYPAIYSFFRRLCPTEADSADLTQKTFAKVWTSLPSFQGRSSFRTWIHGIAHHVYVDWQRSPNRLASQPDEWWLSCPAAGPNPADLTIDRDAANAVYAAIDQLDDASRETIHLHYYQGLTLQETAQAQGIATSTVKYRIRAALAELRSRILTRNDLKQSAKV